MAKSNYHLLSAITLVPRKQNWNFFISVFNGNKTFISQIYRVVDPLGGKLDFFNPLVLEAKAKSDFDHKVSKLKPRLIRASE